jgi:ATP-binding cassette, subfamily B (MDR/TAP), member 1
MATTPVSNTPDEKEAQEQGGDHASAQKVGWQVLFTFTTRQHIPLLSTALVVAVIAALTLPAQSILLGMVFKEFTAYAAGNESASEMLHKASRVCIYLTGVCALCWISNSFYFSMFLAFGELQARNARDRVFECLLAKDMAWFDLKSNGIAAVLPSLQM